MRQRGRPPKPEGALTPAQRKAAQRERDRVAIHIDGSPVDDMGTSALVESLPGLLAAGDPVRLGAVLQEIGRRGGLKVSSSPA